MPRLSPRSRLARALATAVAALAVTAPAASAAKDKDECPPRTFGTVFAAWGDDALYTLAPDGDFELGAAGWTLTGGASVVAGSSPFFAGASSLELPEGSSALSPPFCVGKAYPRWRFAARGEPGARIKLKVVYPKKTKRAGRVRARAEWGVVRAQRFATGRFGKGPASIQVRLTAVRGGAGVDDVYVDPRYRR